MPLGGMAAAGAQCTCFTGTKVQILTPVEPRSKHVVDLGSQFTCFTGTKVYEAFSHAVDLGAQCTCFTGTKGQISAEHEPFFEQQEGRRRMLPI